MLPMSTLILTLCANSQCVEKAPFDPLPSQICAIQGQIIAADWLGQNMPGYHLIGWKCQAGERRHSA